MAKISSETHSRNTCMVKKSLLNKKFQTPPLNWVASVTPPTRQKPKCLSNGCRHIARWTSHLQNSTNDTVASLSTDAKNFPAFSAIIAAVTFIEVVFVISSLNDRKSFGPDMISNKNLEIPLKSLISYLCCIISAVLRLRFYWLASWKATTASL